MPLNTTVKFGREARVFLSSSSLTLLSIDTADVATENVGGTIVWDEIGFLRYPITFAEPQDVIDVHKRYDIDHVKRGIQQRRTASIVGAFQNTGTDIRRYKAKQCLVKVEWHVDDAGAVDEYEYLKDVRFTNVTRDIADGEVVERADVAFADYGRRDGP